VSAEWFAPVDRFTVVELTGQDGGQPAVLTQELKSVFNVGLGVEHDFGNELVLYGAGLTDFTASVGDPTVNIAVSNWNLYHLSGGVKFAFVGNRFTLGATYTFGGKTRPLPAVIPSPLLPEGASEMDASYRRIVVLLGFLFGDR
jgi:hypothetical protein